MRLNNAFYDGVPIVEAYYNGERIELSDIVVYGTVEDNLTIGDFVEAKVGQSDNFDILSTLPMSESIYPTKFAGEVVEIDGDLEISNGVVPSALETGVGEINIPLNIDEEVNPTPTEGDIFDPSGKVEIDGEYEAFGVHSDIFDPNGVVSINDNAVAFNPEVAFSNTEDLLGITDGIEAMSPEVILDAADDLFSLREAIEPTLPPVILDESADTMTLGEEIEGTLPNIILAGISDTLSFEENVEGRSNESATPGISDDIEIGDNVEAEATSTENTIHAGVYYGRSNITSLEVGNIHVPFEATMGGVTESRYSRLQFYTADNEEYYLYGVGHSYISEELGSLDQISVNPQLWKMAFYTDDLSIRVLEDTTVPNEEYALFNKYFTPYEHVVFAGDYTFKTSDPSPYVDESLSLPISFVLTGNTEISIGDEVLITPVPQSVGMYYIRALYEGSGVSNLYWIWNNSLYVSFIENRKFTVTEDTPLTVNDLNIFNDLFTLYQQSNN